MLNPESRVIITSRNRGVLTDLKVDIIYRPELLGPGKDLELFCLHAFKEYFVIERFEDISRKFVEYAKGLPLALKILGYSSTF